MRALVAGIVIPALTALTAWAGPSVVSVASASSRETAAVPDRGADRGDAVAQARLSVSDSPPVRGSPRRAHPPVLTVVSVPFVCTVHRAEGGTSAAATD